MGRGWTIAVGPNLYFPDQMRSHWLLMETLARQRLQIQVNGLLELHPRPWAFNPQGL